MYPGQYPPMHCFDSPTLPLYPTLIFETAKLYESGSKMGQRIVCSQDFTASSVSSSLELSPPQCSQNLARA